MVLYCQFLTRRGYYDSRISRDRTFQSIDKPQRVSIDQTVTVLVGMNEAGKTVFLNALEKSHDALDRAEFDPIEDYPRKDLPPYLKRHENEPEKVAELTYRLTDAEVTALNQQLHTTLKGGFTFSVTHNYANKETIDFDVDEGPVLKALAADPTLSSDAANAVRKTSSLREIPVALKEVSPTEEDKAFLKGIEARIAKTKWESVIEWEAWKWLQPRIPKFLYFSNYELLPSKMNLADLAQRVEKEKTAPGQLHTEHRAVLALLRMADISVSEFTAPEATSHSRRRSKESRSILPIRSWSFGNRTRT